MTKHIKSGTTRLKKAVSALAHSFDMKGAGIITTRDFLNPPTMTGGISAAFQETGNHLRKALEQAKKQEQNKQQLGLF
ncbi:MAG: hypothetical protein O3B41_08345 [Bacteroidetes bacterium]|nr:hypothetical protein [Bacteroidota bacterium]